MLDAASDGRLLVVPGWCWLEGYATARNEEPACPEDRVAAHVMAGRQELTFDGASYVILAAVSWAAIREDGTFEVVCEAEARATLERMALRASSNHEKTAFTEAAAMLADTKKHFTRRGLYLVRRRAVRDFALVGKEPATPSQIQKAAQAAQELRRSVFLERLYHDEAPVQLAKFVVELDNGETIEGTLDETGHATIENLAAVPVRVQFEPDARPYQPVRQEDNREYKPEFTDADAGALVDKHWSAA